MNIFCDLFGKDKPEKPPRREAPMFILIRRAELHFPFLMQPTCLPGYSDRKRYAALFTATPHTDFSQADKAQELLGRPHDTLLLIKPKDFSKPNQEPQNRLSISAKAFEQPLCAPDAESLVAGDLVDAVLQVYRIVTPYHCGVGASLVYVRKLRKEEINELV